MPTDHWHLTFSAGQLLTKKWKIQWKHKNPTVASRRFRHQ